MLQRKLSYVLILSTIQANHVSSHMFYTQRLLDIPDGKPKWTGLSGESELIEDSPPEAIEKRKREMEEEKSEKKQKE